MKKFIFSRVTLRRHRRRLKLVKLSPACGVEGQSPRGVKGQSPLSPSAEGEIPLFQKNGERGEKWRQPFRGGANTTAPPCYSTQLFTPKNSPVDCFWQNIVCRFENSPPDCFQGIVCHIPRGTPSLAGRPPLENVEDVFNSPPCGALER